MDSFKEFFRSKIPNIVFPSVDVAHTMGCLRVHITEPGDAPRNAGFALMYDSSGDLPQNVFVKSSDMDERRLVETLEELQEFYDDFYSKLDTRLVSVNCHLEMDTFCVHGVEKGYA